MYVYLDFDRTLFDSGAFLKDLENVLTSFHLSCDLFYEYSKKNSEKGFNPYRILKLMAKDLDVNKEIYSKIDALLSSDKKYLYEDTIPFLEYLQNKNYHVILLTKGNKDYQLMKIKNTNILKYFDDLVITLKHKGELNLPYEESVFIDDNPKEIESILTQNPQMIMRIKRENAIYNNVDVKGDVQIVTSLKEISEKKLI